MVSQKGFVHLFALIILVVGLAVGVYLVQHPTIFKPKASTPQPTSTPIAKFDSTPLDQISNFPKPTNHVQTMMLMAFYKESMTPQLLEYLAHEIDYFFLTFNPEPQTGSTPGKVDFQAMKETSLKLKNINPNIKVIIGMGPFSKMDPNTEIYWRLDESDLLHYKDTGQIIRPGNVQPTDLSDPLHGVPSHGFYADINNPQVVRKYVDEYKPTIENYKIDAVYVDGYGNLSSGEEFTRGCREAACETSQYWINGLNSFLPSIKQQLGPSVETIHNGLPEFADRADGITLEHMFALYYGPVEFKSYLELIQGILNKGVKVFFTVQTDFFRVTNSPLRPVSDLSLERFYLASYLLIQKNPLTYFGYHPGPLYEGFSGIYFYRDWNLNFGVPSTEYAPDIDGFYYRPYSHGLAIVNPTDQTLNFNKLLAQGSIYSVWNPCNGEEIMRGGSNTIIQPKTGLFLFYKGSLDCTISPVVLTNPTSTVVDPKNPISWTASSNATSYLIQLDDTINGFNDCSSQAVAQNEGDFCGFVKETTISPTLTSGHSYNLTVYARSEYYTISSPTSQSFIAVSSLTPSSTPQPSSSKIGDLNGNDKVDVFDLSILLSNYGKKSTDPGFNPKADLRKDDLINVFDLSILLSNYGK